MERTKLTADIIFADPPYDFTPEKFAKIPELVFSNELLSEEGLLIIEHSPHTPMDSQPFFSFQKKYGSSMFSFFEYPSKEE